MDMRALSGQCYELGMTFETQITVTLPTSGRPFTTTAWHVLVECHRYMEVSASNLIHYFWVSEVEAHALVALWREARAVAGSR